MNASQIRKGLAIALTNNWPILLQSSPGLGKSEIIESVISELGFDSLLLHPVTEEPTDSKGLPCVSADGKTANFLPYGNLAAMISAKSPLVVFLDDLGQATQSVQAAYMQLILARELNGKKISKHIRFVAATNRAKDGAGVSGIITPLLSRFRAIWELEFNAQDWQVWAMAKGLPLEIIAFAGFKPDSMNTFSKESAKNLKPFACPRTVSFLADWFAINPNMELSEMESVVGSQFATDFNAFLALYRSVGDLLPKIFANPSLAPIPNEMDKIYAIHAALANKANCANIGKICSYLGRIGISEFLSFFWHISVNKDGGINNKTGEGFKLAQTPEYRTFLKVNQDSLT